MHTDKTIFWFYWLEDTDTNAVFYILYKSLCISFRIRKITWESLRFPFSIAAAVIISFVVKAENRKAIKKRLLAPLAMKKERCQIRCSGMISKECQTERSANPAQQFFHLHLLLLSICIISYAHRFVVCFCLQQDYSFVIFPVSCLCVSIRYPV